MQLKLYSFLTLFLAMHFSMAQVSTKETLPKSTITTTFKFGGVDPESKKETLKNIFYDDGTNIYVVTTKDPAKMGYVSPKIKPVIIKYNDQFEPISRLEIESNEGNELYIGAYHLNGSMFFIKSSYDKSNKKLGIIIKKITNELKQDGPDITLCNIDGSHYKDSEIKLEFTPENDKCCLILIPDQDKSENREFHTVVFDNKFSPIYQRKVVLDKKSELVKLMNFTINQKGELYLLNKIYDTKVKEENSENKPGYSYTLKKYFIEGEAECVFSRNDKFIEASSLNIDKAGNIQLAMTYENKINNGVIGVRYFKFNSESCTEINRNDFSFEKEVIDKMKILRNTKMNFLASMLLPEFNSESIGIFYTISILESPFDGSTYLTLQNNAYRGVSTDGNELVLPNNAYLVKERKPLGIYANDPPNYFSEGIVIVKIVGSDVKWQRAIPKSQFYSGFPNYLFHQPVFYKNKLCILYNDEKENEHYNIQSPKIPPKRFNNNKSVYLMMIEIDENGNMIRSTLGNTVKFGTNIDILQSKQTSADRMLLSGVTINNMGGNRQTRMGMLKFQ